MPESERVPTAEQIERGAEAVERRYTLFPDPDIVKGRHPLNHDAIREIVEVVLRAAGCLERVVEGERKESNLDNSGGLVEALEEWVAARDAFEQFPSGVTMSMALERVENAEKRARAELAAFRRGEERDGD